jgi:hypothetical protein
MLVVFSSLHGLGAICDFWVGILRGVRGLGGGRIQRVVCPTTLGATSTTTRLQNFGGVARIWGYWSACLNGFTSTKNCTSR